MLTPKLEQTAVVARDLKEQPQSKFVLIVGDDPRMLNHYAVDEYVVDGPVVAFYREDLLIYACRATEGAWGLVRRSEIDEVPEKSLIEFAHTDHQAQLDYYKQLDPEKMKRAEEYAAHVLSQHAQGAELGIPKRRRSTEEDERLEKQIDRQYL